MEVTDSTSICVVDFEPVEGSEPRPRGFASIRDSLHIPAEAPKPTLLWRGGLSVMLGFFHLLTLNIRVFGWAKEKIFGSCPQKLLYRQLHDIAQRGDAHEIRQFLKTHSTKTLPASYFFSEFLKIPELHSYLPQILRGANICLEGDDGAFCRRWREHPGCYKRISSHNYQDDECFAIDHVLFWVDLDGNTRFQYENSPLSGLLSSIEHTIDYLRYRRDNEQQGVAGISPHTEDFCLRIQIDPFRFL